MDPERSETAPPKLRLPHSTVEQPRLGTEIPRSAFRVPRSEFRIPHSALHIGLAPPDWHYHGFPLDNPEREAIDLNAVVRHAHGIVNRGTDKPEFGQVLHWAHLLVATQGEAGDWPAQLNARTGEPTSEIRTRSPLSLLARLGAILNSAEFETALRAARRHRGAATLTANEPERKRRSSPSQSRLATQRFVQS